jgi:D-3-phosphoglycerate dehydrogenase
VSLHTPGTPETKGMVNKDFLSKMKNDAVLINTARGTVINDVDLLAHLEESKNFWYGTDVFNGEPTAKEIAWDNPIAKHPRVVGHHHVGASTKQAESAIGDEAVRIVKKFAASGSVDNANCVNKETDYHQLHKISIRHFDKVGVLAHAFQIFAKNDWNVQELENIVFKERNACVANI